MDDLIRQWRSICCDVLIQPWLANFVCVDVKLVVHNIDGLKVNMTSPCRLAFIPFEFVAVGCESKIRTKRKRRKARTEHVLFCLHKGLGLGCGEGHCVALRCATVHCPAFRYVVIAECPSRGSQAKSEELSSMTTQRKACQCTQTQRKEEGGRRREV
jgi:hypothetical protein